MKKKQICSFDMGDFLRFLATMFVFLFHGRVNITNMESAAEWFQVVTFFPAWAGVWIFVFLSGYGIELGFLNGKYKLLTEDNRICKKELWRFYVKRFLKIAPIYYVYCLLFECLSGNYFFWKTPDVLLKMMLFQFNGNGGINGVGHLWYVSLAMQLYIIMPFIALLLQKINCKKKELLLLILCCVIGAGIRIIYSSLGASWYTQIYTNWFTNIDLVIAGMLVADIKVKYGNFVKINLRKSMQIVSGILFIMLVLYNCYIYYLNTSVSIYIYRIILPSIYLIVCSLLILLGNVYQKERTKNLFTFFSKYSYGFYILHIVVFIYLKNTLLLTDVYMNSSPYLQYVLFFGISFVITLLMSKIVTKNSVLGVKSE